MSIVAMHQGDFTLYSAPDFPFIQDGTRAGEAFRETNSTRRGRPSALAGATLKR